MIIFPGSDLFCLGLSQLENKCYDVLLPSKEIVETLVNKKRFYQSLDKRNIPHPTTYFGQNADDIKHLQKAISYPVYIRPSISQVFSERFHAKGFVAKSEEEMTKYCKLASRYHMEVMVQEIIPGPATNIVGVNAYFDKKSNPKGLFIYQRLREWPHRFGNNSLIESVSTPSISPLRDVVTDYLGDLGYHGLIDAEFKKDPRDGVFKLLEINARCWWQNSFPTKCGINLVFMAYLDAISEKIDYTEKYYTGLKWLYFLNDFRSSLKMLRDKETTFHAWLSSFRGTKDYALFSLDDPLPWTIQPIFVLQSFGRKYRFQRSDPIETIIE
jgi:predicted ATP-grasp superfamily ATP-dependent carboligase